jgi:alpha-D-ribose 1-methylphosphonate 5-triphosphate synthase subunit PhnG
VLVIIWSCCPVELEPQNIYTAARGGLKKTLATDLDIHMTNAANITDDEARKRWLAVLARASTPELESAWTTFQGQGEPEHVRPAESGMVMLRGRVGGTGDAFNLGEASVTRCALRFGDGALGVGYALGRDRRKAELIAIFDALLQDAARQPEIDKQLITPLASQQAARRDAGSRAAAASKVEFFTFVRGQT